MPEEEIKIHLCDGRLMMIRRWHSQGRGIILIINEEETVAGNDDDSRRYLMERVIKVVREDVYHLITPEEEED